MLLHRSSGITCALVILALTSEAALPLAAQERSSGVRE
jgi:hypothetical protein